MDSDEERRVKDLYDNLSRSYDEFYGGEQRAKQSAVLDVIARERYGLFVDAGCGSGDLLQDSCEMYAYAIGFDLSRKMLRLAKNKGDARLDVVQASLRMLPLREKIVDCLVSISALQIDSKLMDTIHEFRRVCQDDGMIAISIFRQSKDGLIPGFDDFVEVSEISGRESIYVASLKESSRRWPDGMRLG